MLMAKKIAPIVVAGIFILATVLGGFYTIEQGYRGVVLRWGKVTGVADSGLHFKIPYIDTVHKMSIRTQKVKLKLPVYSKDIQAADVEMSVNFALDAAKVEDIYINAGMDYAERVVLPQLQSKPKDIFGKYNAVNIVQTREHLTAEIFRELESQFASTGIVIQSVQLENIDFSDAYEHSVEERMKAEVEVQKVQQNLEREKINADMLRAKSKGEADAKLAQAEAQARSIELVGKAEAEAIRAKSEAMKANPDYVKMLQAERWDGKLPQTMLPNGTLPVIGAN